ncbi:MULTISPECIES: TadE/TadG family type IV pilus assembly protein [Nocardioides]|uniref:TadE/TadG family type IV pilus assembly protein n=1 Tax=Nocardioides vastitatis TaxID=2568655 RepID=A0ABW0ZL39_9ACTN|nr:TadE/TadG family type IV pilus assembly protein [Nocardioides sp.]THI99683.1 pilus assembly protein [Nocardioides sp.]
MGLQRRLGRRACSSSAQRGTAAVEFALVSVVLIPILFGILQYGLYFNSSLNADQGVRETARMAVVQRSSAGCSTTGWAAISCTAEDMVGGAPADTYVKVAAPDGWKKGNSLLVCVLVKSGSAFGMLPMPNDGFVRSNLRMSIEQADPAPTGSGSSETLPSGQDWSWCS